MKVVVVLPAYNAERTLEATVRDIPQGVVHEVILVDDGSRDRTVDVARDLGLSVIQHERNLGYGANQKTCYTEALRRGADIIVMIHPDYQYDSTLIPELIRPIRQGRFDVMLGSRIRTRSEALNGGMPVYKYLANRFLTLVENIILGENLSEFHTGFRAYTRRFLETIPFLDNSDDFVFDTQTLVQAVAFGFRIGEIPVPTRYFPESSNISFKDSCIYGLKTLWTLLRFLLHRSRILPCKLFSLQLVKP